MSTARVAPHRIDNQEFSCVALAMSVHPMTSHTEPIRHQRSGEFSALRSSDDHPESKPAAEWWLWPHLCSLDAPLVGLVWQAWWARAAGISLSWEKGAILALSIWLIYLADRISDTIGRLPEEHTTARHAFSGEHRKTVAVAVSILTTVLVVIAPRWLNRAEFETGLGLLALATGYFLGTHFWFDRPWAARVPKEAVVGSLFALGTALFILCRWERVTSALVIGVLGFAVLCFLNCALITRWEATKQDLQEPTSLLNAFPRTVRGLPLICLTMAAASLACTIIARSELFLPLTLSSLWLAWLDYRRSRYSRNALRVLADMVLLTPVFFRF